jgi:ubiquinone/menaquinone biosynthesis C-methylase UbiE|tara:strand:+ start:99 stop:656 length:558 start_codon:yes stop_codon:yes gene_type:complete
MKLNLGCGNKILDGYLNVDKFDYYNVDKVHDLEKFPYPFDNDTVDEILLSHVLEHIGQDPNTFNEILKEFYRVCKNQAVIDIAVPHPRHDDFISDPTHVRPITLLGLSLYDKSLNEEWAKSGAANTPLGLIHKVNFKIESVNYTIEDEFMKKHQSGEIDKIKLDYYMKHYNNVIKQTNIKWRVIK